MAFAHMAVLAPASRAGEPTGSGTANGSPASVWTTPTSSSSGGNSTFGGARSGASSVVGGGDGGGGGGGTTFPRGTAGGGVVARRIGQFDRGVRLSPAPPSQDSPLPLDAVPAISIESPSMGYSSSMPPLPHKQPARSLSTISSSSSASSVSLASTSSSVGSSISSAAPSSLRPNPATDASYGRQPVHRRSPSPNFATQPRAGITTTPELDPHIESDELESAQPTSPTQSSSPSEPQLLDGEGSGSGSAAVEVISSSLSFIAAAARDVTTPSPAALARSSYSPAVAAAAAALTSAPTNSTFFPPLTRLGLPSRQPRPTVVAYDRSQSLLAVGMSDGTILVVGSPPNFEVLLHPPANCSRNSPIKLLRFKVGERFLLSINKRDELVVWNLVTATPRLPLFKAGAEISAIETPAASGWIYLGLISGKVLVFDLKRNRLAEYSIPCPENVLTRDGAADDSTAVVALSVCPVDSNMLLIGFKGGPMMIWNLEKKSIHRKFVFPLADPSDSILDKQPLEVLPDNLQPLSNPSLSAACWRPDGRAVVGARGPYFAFWSLDDPMSAPELSCHKPVIIRSVDGSPSVSDSHMQNINQVEWIAGVDSAASSANISYLLVSGGNRSGDLRGVSIFTVSSDSPYVTDNRKAVLAHDAGIIQFCSFVHVQYTGNNHFSRLPSNPSLPQTCAVSPNDVVIISITESGTIKSHAFHQRVNSFTGLSLSPSLTLLGLPELLGFSIDTISPSFLEDLRQTCSAPQLEKISAAIENVSSNTPLIQSSAPPTPLTGGSASSSIIAAALTAAANGLGSNSSYSRIAPPDLLITAHCDSTLRFWHPDPTPFASPSPPVPLVTLPLTHLITLNRPTGASPVPTHVWFDGSQRSITVASGVAVVVLRYVSLKEAEASPAPASQAAVLTLSSATFPRKYFAHDAAKSNSANSSRSIKPRTSSASQSSGKGTAANSIPARPYPKRTQSVQVLPSSAPTSLPLTSNSGDHSPTSISDGGLQEMSNEEMELLMRKLAPHGVDGTGSLIDLDDDGPHDGNGYSTSSRTPSLNGSIPSPSGSIGGGGVVGPSPTDTSPTLAATKTNSLLLAGGNGSLPHSPVLQPSSPNASVGVWGSVFRKESPNPPNVTGFSESRQGAASSGPETGQSTSIPPTVIVDRFKKGKNGATLIPGWATIAQATYTDAVVVSSYAGWLNILATGLVDGTLCVVDILTGKTVLTDSFGILHNGAPNEVVILHFCETYVDKETSIKPVLCVGTADGRWFLYVITLNSAGPNVPRCSLRRTPLRSSKTTIMSQFEPNDASNYNRPLNITVLNSSGEIVTQQHNRLHKRRGGEASKGHHADGGHDPAVASLSDDSARQHVAENFFILTGSRRAEVLLLEPNRPPRCIAARSLEHVPPHPFISIPGSSSLSSAASSAEGIIGSVTGALERAVFGPTPSVSPRIDAQNVSGGGIAGGSINGSISSSQQFSNGNTTVPRGPGSLIIAAGVSIVHGVPTLVTIARDSSLLAFALPGLEPVRGLAPGAAGGGAWWGLGPRRVKVFEDGRIGCWSSEREVKVMAGLADPARFQTVEPKMYDVSREMQWVARVNSTGTPVRDPLIERLFSSRRSSLPNYVG